MRATIRIHESKGNTLALVRYCVSPNKERAAEVGIRQAHKERILAVFSSGMNAAEIQSHQTIAEALERRTKRLCSRKGKMHRHVIFSIVGEKSNEAAIVALKQLAHDWKMKFCPKSKILFAIHGDGSKLHMHAIVEAYDPITYKRLDWDQRRESIVSEMQDMTYTKAVSPGKGNKLTKEEKKEYGIKQTKRGREIEQLKKKRQSKDDQLAEALVTHLQNSNASPPRDEEDFHDLLKKELPEGWSLNDTTTHGKARKWPSISNGKKTVRLRRIWEWLINRKKEKNKGKCPTCGKNPKACSCGNPTDDF